jgi:hypothetical protein
MTRARVASSRPRVTRSADDERACATAFKDSFERLLRAMREHGSMNDGDVASWLARDLVPWTSDYPVKVEIVARWADVSFSSRKLRLTAVFPPCIYLESVERPFTIDRGGEEWTTPESDVKSSTYGGLTLSMECEVGRLFVTIDDPYRSAVIGVDLAIEPEQPAYDRGMSNEAFARLMRARRNT